MTAEETRDHPLWPAFKKWADENLPGMMLGPWWECWVAATETERERCATIAREERDKVLKALAVPDIVCGARAETARVILRRIEERKPEIEMPPHPAPVRPMPNTRRLPPPAEE